MKIEICLSDSDRPRINISLLADANAMPRVIVHQDRQTELEPTTPKETVYELLAQGVRSPDVVRKMKGIISQATVYRYAKAWRNEKR